MDDLPDTSGWDDGTMPVHELTMRMNWPRCAQCGTVLWVGMRQTAKYCSNACRCKAYRQRKKET